jgi:hypothetical protein
MMKFQLHIEADSLSELLGLLHDNQQDLSAQLKAEKKARKATAEVVVPAKITVPADGPDGQALLKKYAVPTEPAVDLAAERAAALRNEPLSERVYIDANGEVQEKPALRQPIVIGGPESGAPAAAASSLSDDELKGKLETLMRAAGFPHGVEAAQAGLAKYASAGQLPSIPAGKREEFLAFVQSEIARLKGAA